MKLYIDNSCNINSLKILCVSEFYSTDIKIENSSDLKCSAKIPLFKTSDGLELFSSNATCRYLNVVNGKVIDVLTEHWLEWESTVLQPSILYILKTSKGEALHSSLRNNLLYLNSVLEKQAYLSSKDLVGLSDVVIWANIYPLCVSSCISEELKIPFVYKWAFLLSELAPLKKAFLISSSGCVSENLKKKLVCSSVFNPEHIKFFMPIYVSGFSVEAEVKTGDTKNEDECAKEPDVTAEEIAKAFKNWTKGKNALPVLKKKEVPLLPKKGEKNILVTSALPYVNNIPHLGNIIGSVLSADVFARYCRIRGYNTLYICGTDEYGTATETKAIELGMTPQEICDKFNKLHTDIYKWFNISFDLFGRTTTSQQTEIAQDIFKKLHAKDLLISETVEQLYCEKCERFLADRFVEGTCPFCAYEDARGDQCDKCGKLINAPELKNSKCKLCKTSPHMRASKHLFLNLPKIEPSLKQYLDRATSDGHWSNTAKVIAYSWLKDGLKPRCITRDLKWGTPVPLEGFTDKVFYVWFDAPIGYLSITANYTKDWEKWWKQPDLVQLYQFMAKDNVPFHSIIFPASQIGTQDNYTIVNHLSATEYLNYEEAKFSKSRGIGVFGDNAKDTGIPSDIWRFYLLYIRPEAQDTYFSWSDLMLKNNSELLNNLGNFINRGLSFVSNSFSGIVPEMILGEAEKKLIAQVDKELKAYIACLEKTRMRDAIRSILNISRFGNQFIQANKPWELVKGTVDQKAAAGTVLGLSVNICCLLCTLMEPYMPDACANLKSQLNTNASHHVLVDDFVCLLPSGHKIGKPSPLFKKIEQETITSLKAKYAGQQSPEKEPSKNTGAEENCKNSPTNVVKGEGIEELTEMVTKQGNKVRDLKANKASKVEIDKEVATLLEFKKQLALAKGETPEQTQGKSKSKKKR
ncbi:methionine--tRNA ligase, cytoplasmic-like [Uloborus diversus]|uniref:methionine--tRNA ligase, cytoplasmic-like n=1 Tax=Uloborus diversus TaxID=327109 RepID=UPI00240A84D4|nr:methionine--tRNA ligase, cytoplasmic-like [Uloborus diversus]